MYVDSQNGTSYELATLRGPMLHNSGGRCQMEFWYHMYGSYIGTLYVSLGYGTTENVRWSLMYNQGNMWRRGFVNIGRIPAAFQVSFKGKKGYSSGGDIAIDDIKFQDCSLPPITSSCNSNELRCVRGSCVHESRVCDYIDDCGDATDEQPLLCSTYDRCDFEHQNLCNWTHDAANITWMLWSGSTSSSNTGPSVDHTTLSSYGTYLYVEASGVRVNTTARIKSIGFKSTGQTSMCYLR